MCSTLLNGLHLRMTTLLGVLLAVGCTSISAPHAFMSSGLPNPSPQPVMDDPAPLPPEFPVGHFRSISAPGGLVLAFHDRHHFQVFLDNALLDAGSLLVTGAQVGIDSQECAAEGDKPAVYTWLYEENDLTFQVVGSDTCAKRREYLAEEYEPLYLFIRFLPLPKGMGGAS